MSSPDRKAILDDFLGTKCAGCGKRKSSRMSHCRRCFLQLPHKMQADLYKRFGEGYEEAFRASCEFLAARRLQ